jgi:hypothetical protein
LFVVRMSSDPTDVVFLVDYLVAGMLIFTHKERYSAIPKPGEPIETAGGVRLRILKVQCQPELSRAKVECEWRG